jgi:hypothetical protein
MAFASFLTTRRILALTIGAAALSVMARQGATWLETVRRGASDLDGLTAAAVQTTIGRMSGHLHALANEPSFQKNLQWNYSNSVSQTLAATERTGEVEHLAIVDGNCTSIANSSRQVVSAADHWKPVCPTVGNTSKPEVVWNSKNETPILQVAVPIKDSRDGKNSVRWMVAQTALSEAWLRQHPRLANHMRQIAPQAALHKEEGKAVAWKPLPAKIRFGAKISESLVRQLNYFSNLSFFMCLAMLVSIYCRLAWRSNQDALTSGKNKRTLDQLLANSASDDETRLSFSIGYSASEAASEGDLTPDLVALDRLHRNRFAMTQLDIKEKNLWIEDLECQLDETQQELRNLRLSALSHAQQKLLQEGLAKKIAASCQAMAAAHDDVVHYCQEPFLGLSNLISSWRHGSQTMGLKRFTRLLQESTDQLSRRSELENGVLAMTSVQERSFATIFELPGRIKQCLQDLRPAVGILAKGTAVENKIACTTMTLGDALADVASMLCIARPGQRILVRLAQPEFKQLRLDEIVGQAFGKWFFYRAIEGLRGQPPASTVYLNLRGREIKGELLELNINQVTERGGNHIEPQHDDAFGASLVVEDGSMELADRLAISVGIDWSDKKNTGSVTEPASRQLMVRIPISNLEGREGTARVSEVAGMAGRPFDLTNEIAI